MGEGAEVGGRGWAALLELPALPRGGAGGEGRRRRR
jgi:hypothetical protein